MIMTERELYTITVSGVEPYKKITLRDYKPPDIRVRPSSYNVIYSDDEELKVMATEFTIIVGFSGSDPIMKIRVRDYSSPFAQSGLYQLHYTDLNGNPGCVIFNDKVPIVIEPIN